MIEQRDRQTIVRMVRKGQSTEAICHWFRSKYRTQQIAAVRAWVTMGAYGKASSAPSKPRPTRISDHLRERVLRMIRKGWPTPRIMEKIPSLTRQQIAAVRAWVTMGLY